MAESALTPEQIKVVKNLNSLAQQAHEAGLQDLTASLILMEAIFKHGWIEELSVVLFDFFESQKIVEDFLSNKNVPDVRRN